MTSLGAPKIGLIGDRGSWLFSSLLFIGLLITYLGVKLEGTKEVAFQTCRKMRKKVASANDTKQHTNMTINTKLRQSEIIISSEINL